MADAHAPAQSTGVLICDDVSYMRELLTEIIKLRNGLHVVGEACDGKEAIAQAERLQPDIVLLDLSMPVLTGFDALPEIRRVAPAAKIIVLSGFSASMIAADVLVQSADRYLEKGVGPDVIAQAIEELATPR